MLSFRISSISFAFYMFFSIFLKKVTENLADTKKVITFAVKILEKTSLKIQLTLAFCPDD